MEANPNRVLAERRLLEILYESLLERTWAGCTRSEALGMAWKYAVVVQAGECFGSDSVCR
jgi:hypothetical protein